MTSNWPSKDDRESFEINNFIEHYKTLPNGRQLEIVGRGDNIKAGPDYFLKDVATNEQFGVELTSVYIDDKSVPNFHKNPSPGSRTIPNDSLAMEKYFERVKNSISEKIQTAKSNYDTSYPLILSIYLNEYISIFMDERAWGAFFQRNEKFFDQITPFCEIVIWPLPGPSVESPKALSIRPN